MHSAGLPFAQPILGNVGASPINESGVHTWLTQVAFLDLLPLDSGVFWALAVLSAVMVVGAALLVPVVIVRLPADYFVRPDPPRPRWARRHPLLYLVWLGFRNVIGIVFIVAGIVQLFTPGQGVLCIVVGFSLMVFPGKRRIEAAVVGHPRVLRVLNAIRRRYGREPILSPRTRYARAGHDGRAADEEEAPEVPAGDTAAAPVTQPDPPRRPRTAS